MQVTTSLEFLVDLNTVRDGDQVVALLGGRPYLTPHVGDKATVTDEDGYLYDAIVEDVLPDGRVYLRVAWSTQRGRSSFVLCTFEGERANLTLASSV